MEKKKSSGLIILVCILIVLVLGLGGFIVYDKVLNNKTSDVEKPKNNDVQNPSKNSNIVFPTSNDSTAKKYYKINYDKDNCDDKDCIFVNTLENYSNLVLVDNDIKITANCDSFTQFGSLPNEKHCDKNTYTIDEKIRVTLGNNAGYGTDGVRIAKTDKYYIIQDDTYGGGDILIYDLNGNKVKTIAKTISYFTTYNIENITDSKSYYNYEMKLKDNKLYFLVTDGETSPEEISYKVDNNLCLNYIHFKYLELETLKVVEYDNICAITGGQLA